MEDIFKAYDVRGKVGTELTAEIAERIGRALAEFLPEEGPVAVGRDMRPDSKELAEALIKGLKKQGRNVWEIGEVTSDMIYFAVGTFDLAGGAMITASHNPGEYNGIKFCREEAKPIGIESGLADIRDAAISNEFTDAKLMGKATTENVLDDWVTHAMDFIEDVELEPLRIVVDTGNGMAGKIMPHVELKVPFAITPLFYELDGSFPNHIANPLVPENLKDIQKVIREKELDGGIAFDGDGDRAVLLDETGRPLTGSEMTAMLTEYFLEQQPGSTILYNAICGNIVPDTIRANKGIGKRTRVGHSFIKEQMRKEDALFAGEHSGHYYFRDNYYADSGLIAALVALAVISKSKLKISEVVKKYQTYKQIDETNFEVDDKQKVLDAISKEFSDAKIDDLDGLTVRFGDNWFNVRPSNTEPLLRLNAEARTQDELDELVEKAKAVIKKNS